MESVLFAGLQDLIKIQYVHEQKFPELSRGFK